MLLTSRKTCLRSAKNVCEYYSFFTIVGSNLIRQGAVYSVSITSQNFDQPQILEVAIRNSKKEDKLFEVVQNVTLVNGKTQKIEFDVSDFCISNEFQTLFFALTLFYFCY